MADIFEDFEDVLKDNEEISSPESTKIQEPAVEALSKPIVSNDLKLDFQFDDILNSAGAVVIQAGTKISAIPVERIKFSEKSKARISFVSDKMVAIKTHYVEGLGNILCNGKKCCDLYGTSKVRYLAPVVVYDTDSKGTVISKQVECKCLCLAGDSYDAIITSLEEYGSLTGADYVVSCTDEGFQKCSFTRTKEALWTNSNSIVKQVTEFWKENLKHLIKAVAREVSEEVLLKEPVTTVKDADLDEIFKD